MTTQRTLFEGQVQGTAQSTANVTGCTQVAGVGAGLNSAIFDSSVAKSGLMGGLYTTVAGGNIAGSFIRIGWAAANVNVAFKGICRLPAQNPTGDFAIVTFRSAAGRVGLLNVTSAGTLQFLDKVNAATVLLSAAQLGPLLGTKVTISFVLLGGSTTAGNVAMKVYNSAGTLVNSVTIANANLTVDQMNASDIGVVGNMLGTSVGWDDVQINDGGTTELAAYVPPANVAPTVTVGPDQTVTAGTVVTVASTATDSDGTIASRQWVVLQYPSTLNNAPPLTNATGNNVSFTPGVTGLYVLGFSAVDNSGASSSQTTVNIFVPGTTATVVSIVSNTGPWSASQGLSELSDSDDTTYVESPANDGNTAMLRMNLSPLVTPSAFSLTIRAALTIAGTATVQVRLVEGSTVRKTWTVAATTIITGFTLSLTVAEINTVNSWNALSVDLLYTGS